MKTIKERVQQEFGKKLAKEQYYTIEQFIGDCDRYIKACKQNAIICSIGSVAPSGMSRTIKFLQMGICKDNTPIKGNFYIQNFYAFFRVLGYEQVKDSDYFRVHGCGMDMIFHTNYTIIHKLQRLGFITIKTCEKLAQQTPRVI